MRFAILSPIYPYHDGITQFSGMLHTELIREGRETKAFNFKRPYPDILSPNKTQYVGAGDRAIEIEGMRVLGSVSPASYLSTINATRSYASDVLIISYWMFFFVPGYAHAANRTKKHCKVITPAHNMIPHELHLFDKSLASLFFEQCHGFIVMDDSVRYDLRKPHPGAGYTQNPHPLYNHFGSKINKNEAHRKLGIHPPKKNLLFFGLIRDYKGLDLLVGVMRQLSEGYHLIVAGECYGSLKKYQVLIDASPARGRIFVHCEYISDEKISIYLSAADALILSYRSITQSGVISVAYNYDLPMLSTPIGDFKNSIEKPGIGIAVPEISVTTLAQGIKKLSTLLQQAIIPANISKERAALSWEALTRKLLDSISSGFI